MFEFSAGLTNLPTIDYAVLVFLLYCTTISSISHTLIYLSRPASNKLSSTTLIFVFLALPIPPHHVRSRCGVHVVPCTYLISPCNPPHFIQPFNSFLTCHNTFFNVFKQVCLNTLQWHKCCVLIAITPTVKAQAGNAALSEL